MIRIKKPQKVPLVLKNKGEKETLKMCDAYENEGQRTFDFDSKIYGDKTVKAALIEAQHGKCFLCESKIAHISFGDVEHFRPKGGSRQKETEKMKQPGYYWLAYVWENLFLACQICNQRFKKNLFPLENPSARTASHKGNLNREKPLFINPEIENPEQFISFRGEIPFALEGNVRGETTVELLGINRVELNEMRLATLKKLKTIYQLANKNPETIESVAAMNYLQDCISNSHEYASAIRANLREDFKYII